MAAEQFSSNPIEPTGPASLDIFALGVIAFEVFTDGKHPIGVTTTDVWPWRRGIPQKWNRESSRVDKLSGLIEPIEPFHRLGRHPVNLRQHREGKWIPRASWCPANVRGCGL
jgi:hypothetical protein